MIRLPISLPWPVILVLVLGPSPGSAAGEPPATGKGPDLASRVHAIFAEKCTQCHGANVPRPKGKFGYVLDLNRVAANPKLVARSRPEESKLWQLVRDEKMPPKTAQKGSLNEGQRKTIREWIAAGAPADSRLAPAGTGAATGPADRDTDEAGSAPSQGSSEPVAQLFGWLGRFHVTVIHFPIALLIAAALGELWCAWRRIRTPWPPVQFCVFVAAAGALAAVPLGWLLADYGAGGAGTPDLLQLHRWIGTAAGVSAVGLLALSQVDARRQSRSWLFRILLWIGALLVGAAGHFGGLLVHGEHFFDW
jgi:hypothetical protein